MNGTITLYSNRSFLGNALLKLKLNSALKDCAGIKEKVQAVSRITKDDLVTNILITDGDKDINKYVAIKGHNKDGSLKPLKIFTLIEEKLIEVNNLSDKNVTLIDLYDSSITLYDFTIEGHFAEGYVIKKESLKNGYNIIVSDEKAKVFMKNANTHHEFKNLTDFLNSYL